MISEEEFVLKARQEWQHLREMESQSEDFYIFEKEFEHRWMDFGQQAMQGLVGTERKGRREKKTSDTI